jgi:hypothetical protein
LKQRLDLHGAGQLGVTQPVARAVENQEIGEADESAVEHRGLIDDGRAALDGAHGLLRRGGQPVDGVLGPADDRDGVIGKVAQLVEVTLLVLAAEFGCPREQFVLDGDRRTPAELRVERAQQCILAPRCGGEIGCAVDDAVVGDEHAVSLCEPADTSGEARTWVTRTLSGGRA